MMWIEAGVVVALIVFFVAAIREDRWRRINGEVRCPGCGGVGYADLNHGWCSRCYGADAGRDRW